MTIFKTTGRLRRRRTVALLIVAAAMLVSYSVLRAGPKNRAFMPVAITGVHHLGSAYNISDFYVDGYFGGNVGREGGGGRSACCVELPEKWREGLTVEVRWAINDWSQENNAEIDAGNYRSLKSGGVYRARVPVEKYNEPEHLWVHFFPKGYARVVSSKFGPEGTAHPINGNDPVAHERATAGTMVDQLFTDEELAEMARKAREHRSKFGDWR